MGQVLQFPTFIQGLQQWDTQARTEKHYDTYQIDDDLWVAVDANQYPVGEYKMSERRGYLK